MFRCCDSVFTAVAFASSDSVNCSVRSLDHGIKCFCAFFGTQNEATWRQSNMMQTRDPCRPATPDFAAFIRLPHMLRLSEKRDPLQFLHQNLLAPSCAAAVGGPSSPPAFLTVASSPSVLISIHQSVLAMQRYSL
eukprot:GHVS01074580.1.p1 GENE.GHVS01074580.1~~GHVS01074580.1.p1  ORF type:complete len:135 (+),score=7.48 GHVS01074580.1:29-433(+)